MRLGASVALGGLSLPRTSACGELGGTSSPVAAPHAPNLELAAQS